MIENTFIHISGIGKKTEAALWQAGYHRWRDIAAAKKLPALPAAVHLPVLQKELNKAQNALDTRQPRFFKKSLGAADSWRLFRTFRDSCAYIDIETSGLDSRHHSITAATVYDGKSVHVFVNGDNLNDLPAFLDQFEILITFNGKLFDIPFIAKFFNIRLEQVQIDLRFVLKKLKISGGLKKIEKQLGIERENLEEVDGYTAVLLWNHYQRTRDERALETLITYNIYDTINLEKLMLYAFNRLVSKTPFIEQKIEDRQNVSIPYSAHSEILHLVNRHRHDHRTHSQIFKNS